MSVEVVDPLFICCLAGWLPQIVHKHCIAQDTVRTGISDRNDRVLSHTVLVVRVVLCSLHTPVKFREDDCSDAALIGHFEFFGVRRDQELLQLRGNSLGTDLREGGRQLLHGLYGIRFDLIAQLGGEADGPHDPQRILSEALCGVSHCADQALFQVRKPSEQVLQALFFAVGHGIDREIPALQVLLQAGRKSDFRWMPPVQIFSVHPVGGDFEGLSVHEDGHSPVFEACVDRAAEQSLDLKRKRRCRDVPVVRVPSQEAVPHAAADHKGLIAVVLQHAQDPGCSRRNPDFYISHKNPPQT